MVAVGTLATLFAGHWAFDSAVDRLPVTLATARGRVPPEFADEKSCAECHQAVCSAHGASSMGKDWSSWSAGTPAENRAPGRHAAIPSGDVFYQVEMIDGRHFQREYRVDSDGKEVLLNRHEAKWIVGSGHLGRSYLREENGYLFQLPVSWYGQKGLWDLSPGYRPGNHARFGRPILAECVACHSGVHAPRPGSSFAFDALPERGIGCQRCHGPSAGHVAYQRHGTSAADPMTKLSALPPARQQDICLQCHAVADQKVWRDGRDPWSFRPGDALSDHRLDFFAPKDEFGSTAHAPRSMASKCFVASGGKMTCVHCHDPHRPQSELTHAHYNAKCDSCHQQTPCGRTLAKTETARGGDCVACHMPRRPDALIPHTGATEHHIRKPNAPAPKAPANAALQALTGQPSPGDRAEAEVRWLLKKSVGGPPLENAVQRLAGFAEREPAGANAKLAVGRALISLEVFEVAAKFLAAASATDPELVEAARLHAECLARMGKDRAAEAEFKALHRRWPWESEGDGSYLKLLAKRQAWPEILDFQRRLGRWHPKWSGAPETYHTAALSTGRDIPEAYAAAVAADGAWADPHVMMALNAAEKNDAAGAAKYAAAALRANPKSGPAHAAQALAHVLAGKRPEARAEADAALRLAPEHPLVYQVWGRTR